MPRRRQSKFGATTKNIMPFKDSRRRAALQASLARAAQRRAAQEDVTLISDSDSDETPPIQASRLGTAATALEDSTIDVSVIVAPSVDVADTVPLSGNDIAQLRDLKVNRHLHGTMVHLLSFSDEKGKWEARFLADGSTWWVRPCNLRVLSHVQLINPFTPISNCFDLLRFLCHVV
jgi:hypothetical protein